MQKQPTAVLLDTRPAWVFYSDILKGVWKAKKEATAIKKDEKGVVEECVTAVTRCFSCGEEKRRRKFWNNFFPRRPKSKGFWSFSRFWCGTMFLVHKSWYPREIVIKEKTKTNQNEKKRKKTFCWRTGRTIFVTMFIPRWFLVLTHFVFESGIFCYFYQFFGRINVTGMTHRHILALYVQHCVCRVIKDTFVEVLTSGLKNYLTYRLTSHLLVVCYWLSQSPIPISQCSKSSSTSIFQLLETNLTLSNLVPQSRAIYALESAVT